MSWFEANETCRNMGARLVEINSEEENDQIVHEINRIGFRNKHFWIGLTDLEEEGIWRFESNGSEPQYTNWHYNEPDNNTDSDCVRLKKPTNQWKWGDFPCNLSSYNDNQFTIHAICESDLATAGESIFFLHTMTIYRSRGCSYHCGAYPCCPHPWHWNSSLSLQAEESNRECGELEGQR